MDSPLDTTPVPTSQLMEEYGIASRATLKERLDRLGIESFKIHRHTYVQQWQKDILDRQNAHLKAGGKLDTFDPYGDTANAFIQPVNESSVNVAPNVLNELTHRTEPIQIVVVQQPAHNPLTPQHLLAEAVDGGFTLHTEQLLEIIGRDRPPHSPYYFGGFTCERISHRRQWWKISRDA